MWTIFSRSFVNVKKGCGWKRSWDEGEEHAKAMRG